jgi:hypothetical protein
MVAATSNPIAKLRDLYPAFLTQFCGLVLAGSCLDMGESTAAMARVSVAFWCGVIIVLVRRHKAMTSGDHQYICHGLFLLLVMGVPATVAIWLFRGIC